MANSFSALGTKLCAMPFESWDGLRSLTPQVAIRSSRASGKAQMACEFMSKFKEFCRICFSVNRQSKYAASKLVFLHEGAENPTNTQTHASFLNKKMMSTRLHSDSQSWHHLVNAHSMLLLVVTL